MALFRVVLLAGLIFRAWAQSPPARVLIYSATNGFRHDSIPFATKALKAAGPTANLQFDSTEDSAQITEQNLSKYDAILFLSTTGDPLTKEGEQAFYNYINSGGNFIGVHAATACMPNSSTYKHIIGAFFNYHPQFQNATVDVTGPPHPSTAHLPAAWKVQDEMYNFDSDPRKLGAVVVIAANESSYVDRGDRAAFDQGTPHPLAWYQEHCAGSQGIAGRSFYTALGHSNASWADSTYMSHVLGGITWTIASKTTKATNATAALGSGTGNWSPPVDVHAMSMGSSLNQLAPSATSAPSSRTSAFINPASKVTANIVFALVMGLLLSLSNSR